MIAPPAGTPPRRRPRTVGATLRARWPALRRWLVLALGLMGLHWAVPSLILNLALDCRTDKPGWGVLFRAPVDGPGPPGYRAFIAGGRTITLDPAFRSATAYTVWNVPSGGPYLLRLAGKGNGHLAVDGRPRLHHPAEMASDGTSEAWIEMEAGRHLLRIVWQHSDGGGWFSLGVMEPPLMRARLIQGGELAQPRLDGIGLRWAALSAARWLALLGGTLLAVVLLALLLPVTVLNRRPSTAVLVVLALVPAMLVPATVAREPFFGRVIHPRLRQIQPEFVFIGNSMLWSRIDDRHLEGLLGGRRVHSIVNFGGLSGIHYLALKHLLIPSDATPRRTFIFFRSTTLVNPRARTSGPYFDKLIQRLTPVPDPQFEAIAYGRPASLDQAAHQAIERWFPAARSRPVVQEALNRTALWLVAPGSGPPARQRREQVRALANRRFAFDSGKDGFALDNESLDPTVNANFLDFDALVDASFLPPILELSRRHRLALTFIRVQERPGEDGPAPDSLPMQRFMAQLRGYLQQNGAALYDFTGDPELTLPRYGPGDHIADPLHWTELFARRAGHLLQ